MHHRRTTEDTATENEAVEALPEDYYERIRDRLWGRIAANLRLASRVVDFGCGSCDLDRFLARENRQHVIGVDISDGGFPDTAPQGEALECHKADAGDLRFLPKGSVEAVVSLYALHEMERPVRALSEARRILCDGGQLLIVDFPADSLAERLWREHYYAPAEVAAMLSQVGFADVDARLVARKQLIWAEARKPPAGRGMQ